MPKFNFAAYEQLSPQPDVDKGIWSIEPLNPLFRAQTTCDFVDFQKELKNFALASARIKNCQVIAIGDVAYGQRAPNGWRKFEDTYKNQIIVNPGE